MRIQEGTFTSTIQVSVDYWMRIPKPLSKKEQADPAKIPERPWAFLMHGFQQVEKHLREPLLAAIPEEWGILSLNGPFPVPIRTSQGFRPGFSWYFYDPILDIYRVPMEPTLDWLERLVAELNLIDVPKCLIGFSQGGYFAPFVANRLKRVQQVIGIGCRFLDDEFEVQPGVRLDAVHGELDAIVPIGPSRESWEKLQARGVSGSFTALPGVEHRVSKEVVDAVRGLVLFFC